MTTLPEMPCAEFVERVTDFLEGTLDPGDVQRLEDHLAECSGCQLYLEQLRTTLRLTGELRERDLTPEARGALLETFARWNALRP